MTQKTIYCQVDSKWIEEAIDFLRLCGWTEGGDIIHQNILAPEVTFHARKLYEKAIVKTEEKQK